MTFKVKFTENKQHLATKFKGVQPITEYVGGEEYRGAYEVTPKIEAQTMPTKDKFLVDDMTVKAIPFFNVSNTSGGNTVFIGSEV